MHVVAREKEDPFLEADEYAGFQGLIDEVMGGPGQLYAGRVC